MSTTIPPQNESEPSGVLLVDKPSGPTSRHVLDALENRLLIRPLGHAGTLDPLASGLLVVLAGRARRLQEHLTGHRKRYRACFRFAVESETLDGEGPLTKTGRAITICDAASAESLLAKFRGAQQQVPPAHSAVRVSGSRAHRLARRGTEVTLPPRQVVMHAIELIRFSMAEWEVDVTCTAGTYIRSLARDVGAAAGCGAYLASLRRLASGSLRVEDALPPDVITPGNLHPMSEVLAAEGRVDADADDVTRLRNGDFIYLQGRFDLSQPCFAWVGGRPCFRLKFLDDSRARSDLLLDSPDQASSHAADPGAGPVQR